MSDEKIIKRVKNLLAMAEDASSPNEALIAAKRARALMDKHQLSKSDIELFGSEFLETKADKSTTVRKRWLIDLGSAAGMLNDCVFCFSRKPNVEYKFRGFKSDAIVAKLTMDYLIETCERLLGKAECYGVSEKNFYRLGFANAVEERGYAIHLQRKEIVTSGGKDLVVTKENSINAYFGELKMVNFKNTRQPTRSELDAYTKGVEDGEEVGLDKQIKSEKQARINNAA